MKILQLVTKRQYRGAEVFAANLSDELIALGHRILFVGLYKDGSSELSVENALNYDLSENKMGNFSIGLLKNLVRFIKSEKPDVIQCNGSDTIKYMVAASYFLPSTPILYRNISMISEWMDSSHKRILYKYLFTRVSHVSSVGNEAIEDFILTLDYPRNKTSVIRRGIPIKSLNRNNCRISLKNKLNLKKEDKIAIHIGNFSAEKNHSFLLDLFESIAQKDKRIKLICVGKGILFEEIQQEINRRGLNDTIFLLGFRKDIPELLAAADCCVLSSKVEGVPGVILEAGSQFVPAVATDVGGVTEVLLDGETGYLVKNFDLDEFEVKLRQLMYDDKRREVMGQNAYHLASTEYNPLSNARKFEELYLQLSQNKKNPNPEKLKILQVIQKNQYRGAEVFSNQISNHFLKVGHQVEIVYLFEGKASLPFRGKTINFKRPENWRYFDVIGWRKLSDYIKEYKPNIIQANAADTLKYTVLSKLLYRWKTPIVYRNASTLSFYVKGYSSNRFNGFLLKKVDHIVSVSSASKRDINALYPFTASKNSVVPVGLERAEFKDLPEVSGNKNIIHVGSFTKEKNHIGLLNIFEQVNLWDPAVKLFLLGEGPLKLEVKKEVDRRSLTDNIVFLDVVQNPISLINSFQLIVLPSVVEGLPGVILEAMYCKVPVVAYNVGGISEILNESTGYLIPKGEENLFVQAIKNILINPDKDKIEAAHKMVTQEFLNEQIAEKFSKIYNNVLNEQK